MNYFFDALKSLLVGLAIVSIPFGIVEFCFNFGYSVVFLLICSIGLILCILTLLGYAVRALWEEK